MFEASGSVRVDLLGGTLDLSPINLIIPKVVTLNLATTLTAKVRLEESDYEGVEIFSEDYQTRKRYHRDEITTEKIDSGHFEYFRFVIEILHLFNATSNLKVYLSSGSPAGAGLGGSSAMGMTLYKALSKKFKLNIDRTEAIRHIMSIESRILDSGPAGYQDYYPALFGGVLALHPEVKGVRVEQLYCQELSTFLENQLTLVFSGEARHSGINNWEVYKAFFDKNEKVRHGLNKIGDLSYQAYESIKNKNFSELAKLISEEGLERSKLFPGLVSNSMTKLHQELQTKNPDQAIGLKVCGAGGGGCFLIVHEPALKMEVEELVSRHGMRKLELSVAPPIDSENTF